MSRFHGGPAAETVKPPDNVLAALRVQLLDAAMQSQLNIPAKTTGVVVSSVEAGSAAESADCSVATSFRKSTTKS